MSGQGRTSAFGKYFSDVTSWEPSLTVLDPLDHVVTWSSIVPDFRWPILYSHVVFVGSCLGLEDHTVRHCWISFDFGVHLQEHPLYFTAKTSQYYLIFDDTCLNRFVSN